MRPVAFRLSAVVAIGVALATGIASVQVGPMVATAWALEKPGPQEPLIVQTTNGPHVFQVEIAADDAARADGLMFRTEMAPDAGMLFDFKREDNVYFWMKNTYVSLDMVFIRADGTVASVATNTVPLSEKTVPSQARVRFVLEVIAGTAQRIGLKAGDKVVHRLMKTAGPL